MKSSWYWPKRILRSGWICITSRPIFLEWYFTDFLCTCTQFRHIVQLAACGGSVGRAVTLQQSCFCWLSQTVWSCFLICKKICPNTCYIVFLSSIQVRLHRTAILPSYQIWSPCWLQRQWQSWWWSAWSTCHATSPRPSAAPTPRLLQLAQRHRYVLDCSQHKWKNLQQENIWTLCQCY